jgi:cyclopropane-fatty-acyl-phospholipid synthase
MGVLRRLREGPGEHGFKEHKGGALDAIASDDAVRLDEFNFAEIGQSPPAKARMVLSAAMNPPRARLKVR